MKFDVVIIGGCGHVGLPLAIALALKGQRVCAFDVDEEKTDRVAEGEMPFMDDGADEALPRALKTGCLKLSHQPSVISQANVVIVTVGTPVDEHLNPEFAVLQRLMDSCLEYFRDGQLIIIRSTVYPGATEKVRNLLRAQGKNVELAFCPERIAEGAALRELETLPQIISSFSDDGVKRSRDLFGLLTPDIIVLDPIEAELAKLFSNTWRYLKFACANQFFMIANDNAVDFHRVRQAMTYKYPRCADLPGPGFAAGPCLFKDSMQLAAFNNNSFYLGHAAMLINEGLPNYIVSKLKGRYDLREMTVGILGMAFKGNIDDPRESLSYKLRKILAMESRRVLCSDVYIKEPDFVTPRVLAKESDIIILATPHREYASLKLPKGKPAIDIWNVWGKGSVV